MINHSHQDQSLSPVINHAYPDQDDPDVTPPCPFPASQCGLSTEKKGERINHYQNHEWGRMFFKMIMIIEFNLYENSEALFSQQPLG